MRSTRFESLVPGDPSWILAGYCRGGLVIHALRSLICLRLLVQRSGWIVRVPPEQRPIALHELAQSSRQILTLVFHKAKRSLSLEPGRGAAITTDNVRKCEAEIGISKLAA